jgi:hypothetical protein
MIMKISLVTGNYTYKTLLNGGVVTVEFEIEDTSDDYGHDYRVNCNGIFFEGVDITDILSGEKYQELVDEAHADWRE